tara:strand:+ start:210 stop:443 length:234 start_codon:yes stop_codon:yes gene_type:complete
MRVVFIQVGYVRASSTDPGRDPGRVLLGHGAVVVKYLVQMIKFLKRLESQNVKLLVLKVLTPFPTILRRYQQRCFFF